MSDDALYRAIVANPEEDTPRLVYADWLQENDRPEEAEFVRVQCRLEASAPDHPEYADWLDREAELELWLTARVPGPELKFPAGLEVEGGKRWWPSSRRGFPRFLEFDGHGRSGLRPMRALAAALGRAFAVLPTRWLVVRFVTVDQLAELLRQPAVAGLDRITVQLNVTDDPQDEAARLIADCPHFRNLRGMDLGFLVGDVGAAALARSEHLSQLEWLSLSHCELCTAAAVRSLGSAGWFRGLRALELSELDDDAFEELCRLDPFPDLHTLELYEAIFPTGAWQTFARSKAFPRLTRLRNHTGMAEGQAEALARAGGLRLTDLDLSFCAIGNDGAEALARAPWLGSLRRLSLAFNLLGPAGFATIAASRDLTGLKYLNLSSNWLGIRGLRALAGNPALRGLTTLVLKGNEYYNRGLTQAHLHEFLTHLDLPALRHLVLSGRPVGGRAARVLASQKFRSLTRLELNDCGLTDAAVAALVEAPALQNLIELDLGSNKLHDGLKPLADPATLPHLSRCNLADNRIGAALGKLLRRRPVLA
jgi:uncharacterized protein (TIGR02996 family)